METCPICRNLASLVSDHDHATGESRERICGHCNSGLGFFRDSPTTMRAAAEYIERHRARFELLWSKMTEDERSDSTRIAMRQVKW